MCNNTKVFQSQDVYKIGGIGSVHVGCVETGILKLCMIVTLDQMECYCEALVQELEENQKQMLGELQNLRIEHSTCVYAISSTKAQMETMRQDMNEQILRFSEDGHDLDSLDQELERRVITSEATIKKAHSHSLLRMSAACATWSLVVCRGLLLLLKLLLELNLKKFLR